MHSSGSFHLTLLERTRGYLDIPANDAKYLDAYVLAHAVLPAMVEVIGRLNLDRDNPILIRFPISLVSGQEYYSLPYAIENIWRFAVRDEFGNITSDYYPGGIYNPRGPGWYIEENTLVVSPLPGANSTVDIWYTPNASVLTHYATDGSLSADRLTLTLGTATYGQIDRRKQAYLGQLLRLIPATGMIEERIIVNHDVVANTVTARLAFSSDVAIGAGRIYEIAPMGSQPLYDAIALRAAMKLGVSLRISQSQRQGLKEEYNQAIRTIGNNLTNLQMRIPDHLDKNTVDNPDWWKSR